MIDANHPQTTPTPGSGYDVVVLMGQSNMVGRGEGIDPALDTVDDRVDVYGASGPDANRIVQARDPLPHRDPQPDTVGPGMEFARRHVATLPSSRRLLLVACAKGASAFFAGDQRWKTDFEPPEDNLYRLAIEQTERALAAAGEGSRLVGFLWHQGESDAPVEPAAYTEELRRLLVGLREHFDVPDAWFVAGQLNPAGFFPRPGRVAIDTELQLFPTRYERTAFAFASPLHDTDDTLHFSARGNRRLGAAMAAAVPLAVGNHTDQPISPPGAGATIQGPPGAVSIRWERPPCPADRYEVEYREASRGPWTTGPRSSLPTDTAVLPVPRTLQVRLRTVRGVRRSAWSRPFNARPTPFVLDGTGVQRAHGLRRLLSSYDGPCLRLRRSRDGREIDIGFTSDQLVDQQALLSFCGPESGYVSRWYDQVGSAHLSQANPADQPLVWDTGGPVLEDGRLVLDLDGRSMHLISPDRPLTTGSAYTALLAVQTVLAGNSGGWLFGEAAAAAEPPLLGVGLRDEDGTAGSRWRSSDGTVAHVSDPEGPTLSGRIGVLGVVDDSDTVRFATESRVSAPVDRDRDRPTDTTRFAVGALPGEPVSSHATMRLSEAFFWTSVLSEETLRRVVADQAAHHRLAGTQVAR